MNGGFTDRQAAETLGVHRLAVEQRLLNLGWVVDVGARVMRTTPAATSGGYLQPVIVHRLIGARPPIALESGYRITATGMAVLRRVGAR